MSLPTVAVLGLGNMGYAFARNLLKNHFRVHAWNREKARGEPLLADGVNLHDTPGEAVESADVILSVLADAKATLGIISETAPVCKKGAVFCQMGTIGIDETSEAARLLHSLNPSLCYIDAPVSGSKTPAENGEILVLASGDKNKSGGAEIVFNAVSRKTLWLGELGKSQKMKLILNSWLIIMMEGIAESTLLASKLGFTPTEFWQALDGGPLATPYIKSKLEMIAENDYTAQMKLSLALKDANLALDAAEEVELPVLTRISDYWSRAVREGYADYDLAAVYAWLADKRPDV
ncbi:6-phosphogluconate dehydrogenase, NAD-binding [Escherichia coli TA206]|uniref:NAD(P)-dependent oxidoreductase n=2 Tax=Escherichia coli TaxID=562 RepID=UPI0001E8AA58|nr:NAD(P)-dependent oxidoreductase [Escherichia coli]EGI25804.1 6-phosphogluconate dehydrogenase, NAD-binding [Escherichia coli TA206]